MVQDNGSVYKTELSVVLLMEQMLKPRTLTLWHSSNKSYCSNKLFKLR